jgi:hypothetical protein
VFVPNPNDSADVEVTISFADGAREDVSMDLANPESAHSWRLAIGTPVGTPGPPSAKQSPTPSACGPHREYAAETTSVP